MSRTIGFLVLVICVAVTVGSVSADPNTDVVRAYRVLAPDYSKTTGGTSPALSPDGDTLAYMSNDSQVWIVHGLRGYPDKIPEPWRLQFDLNGAYGGSTGLYPPRNLDWSPNGKRLAIAFTSGSVYIAESFDFEGKTAKVRQLGSNPHSNDGMLHSPRWSPDGMQLVVARNYMQEPVRPYGVVSVMDSESGAETVLGKDASWGGELWGQPWSPDGKSIVYASGDSGQPGDSIKYNIVVVSVDGKTRRQITMDSNSRYPAWSPDYDRIAFCSHRENKLKYPSMNFSVGYSFPAVWTVDSRGGRRKLVSPVGLPTKQQIALASTTIKRLMVRDFEKQYGAALTPAQRKLLERGRMTPKQMQDIALAVEAKKIGGQFQKLAEEYLRTRDPKCRGDLWMKALSLLPPDTHYRLSQMLAGMSSKETFGAAMKPLVESDIPMDSLPVWSPDGGKLIFTRERALQDHQGLYVLDLASGKYSVAYTSGEISNVSWAKGSGSIVLESKRFMSLHPKPAEPGEPLGYESLVTKPGYPEVWELTLK